MSRFGGLNRWAALAAVTGSVWTGTAAAQATVPWTSWAGDSTRQAIRPDGSPVAQQVFWSVRLDDALPDEFGSGWTAVGPSSPVIHDGQVLVYAQVGDAFDPSDGAIVALDSRDGALRWATRVGPPQLASWSSPTVDPATGTVIIGSGPRTLRYLDAATGRLTLTLLLKQSVVNATAAVGEGRTFITDFDGFGTDGTLYAAQLDLAAALTPDLLHWHLRVGGTSGATPTYHDGVVYVASINDGSGGSGWPAGRGQVYAFDAGTATLLWQTPLPDDGTLGEPFGGLAYYDGYLYLATYDFFGGDQSAGLYKLDAANGSVVWGVPANRSETIPVVWQRADSAKVVVLSGGNEGFGTHQELQFFDDEAGAFLGETSVENDVGWVGNWTYQPAIIGDVLYVGGLEADFFAASEHLWAIDLSRIDWDEKPFVLRPDSPAVLADLGPGSSPAYFTLGNEGHLVTYGLDGWVVAYGRPPRASPRRGKPTPPVPGDRERGTEPLDAPYSPFAAEVIEYVPGTGIGYDWLSGEPFDDPTAALGPPTTDTTGDDWYIPLEEPVPVVPVYPPFRAFEVVTIGVGGRLTLRFDHPVRNDPRNPYGLDFIVFGNAAAQTAGQPWTNGDPNDVVIGPAGLMREPGLVSISQDGTTWYTYSAGPYADDFAPTLGRRYEPDQPHPGLGEWNLWWGRASDPTRPLPPGLSATDFAGKTVAQVAELYGNSAGGTGFDIGGFGLAWVQYVRMENAGLGGTPEIDAIADVSPLTSIQAALGPNPDPRGPQRALR